MLSPNLRSLYFQWMQVNAHMHGCTRCWEQVTSECTVDKRPFYSFFYDIVEEGAENKCESQKRGRRHRHCNHKPSTCKYLRWVCSVTGLVTLGHGWRRDYRASTLHHRTIWYWSIQGARESTQFSGTPTGDFTRFRWIVSIQWSHRWLWLNEVSPKSKPKVISLRQGEAGLGKDGRETRDDGRGGECSHDVLCTWMTSWKTDNDTRKACLQSLPWLTSGNLDFRRVNSLEIHEWFAETKGDDAVHAGGMPSPGRFDVLECTRQKVPIWVAHSKKLQHEVSDELPWHTFWVYTNWEVLESCTWFSLIPVCWFCTVFFHCEKFGSEYDCKKESYKLPI